jgi:hypothetical protein
MLPAKVRQYFADIGRRGGTAGRRELTRQQARLMVAIREARRVAKKEGKPPPKLSRQHRAISRTASVTAPRFTITAPFDRSSASPQDMK